ncbi:MAG TPA: hypothetical protein VM327_01825 [Candidatus Thermoplasmatota archaeon]|nr:hypothetical protein [Candidatus Thermoplasmatota archaeon]
MKTPAATALAVLVMLAGCAARPGTDPSASGNGGSAIDPAEFAALPFLETEHDHIDPSLHQGGIRGWTLTAHLPLEEDRGTGYQGEIDVMGDLLVAAFEQNPGGVTLVDISDPDHPQRLSHIALDDVVVADVKLSPDAKTLFVATCTWLLLGGQVARLDNGPDKLATLADAIGVVAYDVSDPSEPRRISTSPVGRDGVHMIDLHVIDGRLYVFATTPFYSLHFLATQFLPVGSPDNSVEILRWDGRLLVPVSRYDAPEKIGTDFAHDMTVVDDGDQVLMLTAYYDDASIADVTDPASPRHLGSFDLTDNGITGSDVHTVMMQRVGDRRILVTSPELGTGGEILTIDATDPAHPTLLGRWGLPHWDQLEGSFWSPHNVNLLDGRAYLAHYHAGAWVLDLSTDAALAQPTVQAYFAPADLDHPPAKNFLYNGEAPSTWDVLPAKGRVFVSDMGSGLYVLKPDWPIGDAAPYGSRGAS